MGWCSSLLLIGRSGAVKSAPRIRSDSSPRQLRLGKPGPCVSPDSPGAKAGLQKGDVITSLNGQKIADYTDLRLRISQTAPGTKINMDVYRNGQKMQITASLGEFPEKAQTAENSQPGEAATLEGVQVENLTPDITQQLNLPAGTRGARICGSTAKLMADFYAQLSSNVEPADALREAKLHLLHSNSAYRKPFYWAPFQLYIASTNER